MNFIYNRSTQILEFHRESGMQQNVAVPESELEKLYHCLWVTLCEKNNLLDNLSNQ
jgi:hypothetical protein